MKLLFQGDSVTEAKRDYADPADLGHGYVRLIAEYLKLFHPDRDFTVLNRGVSGDRSIDLVSRWQQDTIRLAPELLTILIGINDTWYRYDFNEETTLEMFEKNYRSLLEDVRTKLPDTQLILMEPFHLPCDESFRLWHADLANKQLVTRELAREYGARFVPLNGIFADECTRTAPQLLAADSVHPTPLGHALIAKAWLNAAGLL